MTISATLDNDVPARRSARLGGFVLALLLAWVALWKASARGLWGPDDAYFLETSHLWLAGAPPYAHAFDVKPPGFYALLAGFEAVFGPSLMTLTLLSGACEAATGFCLWRIGVRLGAPVAGLFAAFVYPLLSHGLAANGGYPPLALATAAAYLAAFSPGRPWARAIPAGLAMGCAATIKQTAVFEALPLFWLLAGQRRAFALAAAAPPLAFAVYFAARGAFAPFFADVVALAIRRPGMQPESLAAIGVHILHLAWPIWPLAALAVFGAFCARRILPLAPEGAATALALWGLAALVELLSQQARWLNYLGPTFAPQALLAGAAITALCRDIRSKHLAALGLLIVTAMGVWPFRAQRAFRPDDAPAIAAAAAAIRARDPRPDDRLLALGPGGQLNTRLDLAPPTPYFHWMHLVCDFPGAGPQRLREAFAAAPRFVTIPEESPQVYCQDPTAWPVALAALARDYRRIAEIPEGQGGTLQIYERRPR